MDGYDYLAGFLIFFLFFIYIVWFGYSIKEENQNNEANKVKINPYDNIPLHRKLIDKKNPKVGLFDLGNHILIVGFILVVIFISLKSSRTISAPNLYVNKSVPFIPPFLKPYLSTKDSFVGVSSPE